MTYKTFGSKWPMEVPTRVYHGRSCRSCRSCKLTLTRQGPYPMETAQRLAPGCPARLPHWWSPQPPKGRTSTTVDGSGPSLGANPYQGDPIATRTNLASARFGWCSLNDNGHYQPL